MPMRSYSSSQVAACIGKNPYEPQCDILEKMWKSENKESYFAALSRNNPKKSLQQDQKDLHTAMKSESGITIANITDDATLSVSDKVSTIESSESKDLTDNQARVLKRHTKSTVGTRHGIKNEHDALKIYCTHTGHITKRDYSIYKMSINSQLLLKGKVDAVVDNPKISKLVEIKNRTRRLFGVVKDYEYVQVQCYLHLMAFSSADLVEHFKGDINIFLVEYDKYYMQNVCATLCQFDELATKITSSTELQDNYFKSTDRNLFIADVLLDYKSLSAKAA